jgi:hypothetical protein
MDDGWEFKPDIRRYIGWQSVGFGGSPVADTISPCREFKSLPSRAKNASQSEVLTRAWRPSFLEDAVNPDTGLLAFGASWMLTARPMTRWNDRIPAKTPIMKNQVISFVFGFDK